MKGNGILEIKGILFDKDGTLLQFREIWIQISYEIIDELLNRIEDKGNTTLKEKLCHGIGLRNGIVDEKGYLACGTSLDMADAFNKILPKDMPHLHQWLSERLLAKTKEHIDKIKPVCDLSLLFSSLTHKGIIAGIATADDYETTKLCLQQLGILNDVQFLGTADLYKKSPFLTWLKNSAKSFI
ncbi:HAD hydrolase-like protein [Bacillus sp. OVS6]|nr:HAD hydrolase-like protein [Bacillus sp. OVS6]